jgi:hypothetical protein
MIKVNIKDLSGSVNYSGTFKNNQEANEWIDAGIAGLWWGNLGTFTTETIDVSVEADKEAKTMRRKSWQDFGSNLLAEILELNSAKYESGAINLAQLTAMYDDAGLLKIERALKLGDLKAARALIAQLDNSIYSADEKASLVSKLNNKIGV